MENEHKTRIGKNILKILMFSMYPDCKTIYREYIQNACDSINDAVREGIISNKEGHIYIKIDSKNAVVKITDNGTGIKTDEVAHKLKDIADSDKDGVDTIGFYGIGRLVGAGYCRELTFKTSYKGEAIATEITFDVEKAQRIIDDKKDHSCATEVIDAITAIKTFDETEDKHYFCATLKGVRREYPELLNETQICDYLKQVAPIDYTMPFKSKLVKPSFKEEFEEFNNQIKSYKISVNKNVDIRKTYNLKVEGTEDEIHSLKCFSITDDDYGLLAWGWYGITEFTRAIPPSVKNRGIRLRKHNILVGGPDILNQYFSESRGNNYFVGELHAVHENLNPEGSRSGLAPTPEAERLKVHLKKHFDELKKLYHLANDVKKAVEKVADARKYENTGQVTVDKVKEAELKLEKIEKSKNAQNNVGQTIINIYKRKLVKNYKNSSSYAAVTNTTTLSSLDKKDNQNTETEEKDIVDNLTNYSKHDKDLLRQVFSIMVKKCPREDDKKLIEELKKLVVKELNKK
ncbi:MAG: ATP-binding protein [Candidatus Azobacteroides sp.]|nr:ATP-binding protein [Candidatus Azobacteroides sp.]